MLPKSLSLNPTYTASSAWWQHVPIAYWLVETIKPKTIVELGTHYGVSFYAFCEAAEAFSLDTFIYAIDSWRGDEHASLYGEDVFAKVENHWKSSHKPRAALIRSTFDDAIEYFEESSIDILHIDGLHTYESVKHDFETWLPKMSKNSLILFHDINVREREFGVWKLWQELKNNYKTCEVLNGHGLGVLILGEKISNELNEFSALSSAFTSKGVLLEQIAELTQGIEYANSQTERAKAEAEQAKAEAEQAKAEIKELLKTLNHIQCSRSFKLIRKLQKIKNVLMRKNSSQ